MNSKPDWKEAVFTRRESEIVIIKNVQQSAFPSILKTLRKNADVGKLNKESSVLYRLDPYLDSNNVLHVGGRSKGNNELQLSNPVILPKASHSIISKRVIEYFHQKVEHLGRTTTANEIRSHGYWIVSLNEGVKKVIFECKRCRFLRGRLCNQKMGDLPALRTTVAAPFTFCGVDMFGTFYVKECRSQVKRYAALFTCFASQAIDIEVTIYLSADSFINALRRFMARRGAVRSIHSDNGTNFVGTDNCCGRHPKNTQKCRSWLLKRIKITLRITKNKQIQAQQFMSVQI